MVYWIFLCIGGLFEIGFASSLTKARECYGTPAFIGWFFAFLVFLTLSMFFLYKATQQIPMGTAYAVWTGIGAVGTVLLGIFYFKEPVDFWRVFFLITLISSVIGLKVFASH